MNEEGWYHDPFGRHEARWISAGSPTALVRDAGVEGQDPPPNEPIAMELEPWLAESPDNGDSLIRADDAESQGFDATTMSQAAFDAIDGATGP